MACGAPNALAEDDAELLWTGKLRPNYDEVKGGQILDPTEEAGRFFTAYFYAYYSIPAENRVTLQMAVSTTFHTGDMIAARDVCIVVTDFSPGTVFKNAHRYVDLDENPETPPNPVFWYGLVKDTFPIDDYRVIQMDRPTAEPFDLEFAVFGVSDLPFE